MKELQNIKKALSEYYSKEISPKNLEKLLNIQKKYDGAKKIMLAPLFAVLAMSVLLTVTIFFPHDRDANSEFGNYLPKYIIAAYNSEKRNFDERRPYSAPPGIVHTVSNRYPGYSQSPPHFGGATQKKQTRSAYTVKKINRNRWKTVYRRTHKMDHGVTATHFYLTNKKNGNEYILMIFENLPNADRFSQPLHLIRDNLTIRIWKERDRVVSIAGKNVGEFDTF